MRILLITKTNAMAEVKRTAENPSPMLQRKVLSLSESPLWSQAKQEWGMRDYYYIETHKMCPCSPREVKHITVLVNKYNHNELEVCNACAERHFNILESGRIATAVRRLKKDISWGMDLTSVDYLLACGAIGTLGHEEYEIVKQKRKKEIFLELRESMNAMLLNLTKYENKAALEKIDGVLAWLKRHPDLDVSLVAKIRIELIANGVFREEELDGFIDRFNINVTRYNWKERSEGRLLLAPFLRPKRLAVGFYLDSNDKKEYSFRKNNVPFAGCEITKREKSKSKTTRERGQEGSCSWGNSIPKLNLERLEDSSSNVYRGGRQVKNNKAGSDKKRVSPKKQSDDYSFGHKQNSRPWNDRAAGCINGLNLEGLESIYDHMPGGE